MSSSSASKLLGSVLVFAMISVQIVFIHCVMSLNETNSLNQTNAYLHHICINSQGTYKPGSPYEENLNRVIRAISITISNYGFVHGSNGDAPNTVFGKLQCQATPTCPSAALASPPLSPRCPKNKGRIIWYDNCLLEISPINSLGKIDYEYNFYMYNEKDVNGDTNLFNKNTRALLYRLKEKATSKENNNGKQDLPEIGGKRLGMKMLYATGEKSLRTMKLYGMVQCTKDLSIKDCIVCLNWIIAKLPTCCSNKQGGRVLSTCCNFRYELYRFVKT
ncbi:putative cysteine-rich repeat secretory protein 22 [Arabidopsis thaliana]|uniref:Gnk2-homologous domain-containing protein n=2 Tax=Arabidopsis TaxID=3701 RepID=A0A178VDB1_ARATH|nr:Gnk2-homologous domain [Arabidopsis thaliana x Arabidopsis arenosa]OAP03651.1 hypothetical protein AXX17_AT3G23560 [Arabidopsis thaliana]